jgi:KDO2-lipid IV(A) lauroyltransferase
MNLLRRSVLTLIHVCGIALGWVARVVRIEYARVSRINIRLVFPELSSGEVNDLVKASMNEFGKLALEMLFNWFIPTDVFKKQIRQIHGENYFKQALQEKRGLIIIHPHLGNWEIFNYILGPYRPYALYKPIRNEFINKVIKKSRQRPGTRMIVPFSSSGVRKLYRVLDEGGIIKALPDQLPDGPGSLVADFFNVPAGTGTLLPRLIQKTHPAVICCYARRLPKARGFDIYLVPALKEIYSDDLQVCTTAMNKSMEQLIRLSPEQYLWGYKRFKYTVDRDLYSRNSSVNCRTRC